MNYFFGVAGAVGVTGAAGLTGTEVRVVWRSSPVPLLTPALLVAMIESEMDVNINTTVEIVVAFESSVADPRGPKAV